METRKVMIGYGIFLAVVGGALVLAELDAVIVALGVACLILGAVMVGSGVVKQ